MAARTIQEATRQNGSPQGSDEEKDGSDGQGHQKNADLSRWIVSDQRGLWQQCGEAEGERRGGEMPGGF